MADPQAIREKVFYKSRTLWGSLVAFVPVLVDVLGGGGIQDLPWISDAGLQVIDNINEIAGVLLIGWARYSDGGGQAARLTLRR